MPVRSDFSLLNDDHTECGDILLSRDGFCRVTWCAPYSARDPVPT